MTREEQIILYLKERNIPITSLEANSIFEGIRWADANPNKKLVYTKKELLDMGFGFDLNGNISTPQEIEERSKKYINHRKDKWIKKACEWLDNNAEDYIIDGELYTKTLMSSFREAMEE